MADFGSGSPASCQTGLPAFLASRSHSAQSSALRAASQTFEAAGHGVLAAVCALQAARDAGDADAARSRLLGYGVRAPDKFAAD